MKIQALNIFLLEVPLGGQIFNPRILWHRKQSVLVRLVTEEGVEGWGECWCFDNSADALIRFLQSEIRPRVLGADANDPAGLWQDLWSMASLNGRHGMMAAALSGVDIALHDVLGKRTGRALGAAISIEPLRDRIPVYASGGLYRKDDAPVRLADEMRCYVAAGHNRIKMKIGALAFEQDVARVRAVREAVGPDVGLIVDAVYSLDRARAEKWLGVWREFDVEAVQAPFPTHCWEEMRWLNRDCGVPVMVFEAESRFEIFRALLEFEAIGALQFSPIAVGGITAARRLIALASDYRCDVSLQCSSTWLTEKVALEIARGHSQVRHVELHTLHTALFDQTAAGELQVRDGQLSLASCVGLGVSPDVSRLLCVDEQLPDMQKIPTPNGHLRRVGD
ncbi:mandelate racemase/muconate lactonizing enzyme family protein [Salinicola lusitanus]|uniref:Mandelate racemase/muconate lactonizing enzyme family protein n=1 Tax=Salinicola lusitanus TaxID=1949085 RepID=A0ABZ3CT07_9GAMM|nr:mandelate racemase/muconate lactonizing enzyme family protein [Salinicola lusitanus]